MSHQARPHFPWTGIGKSHALRFAVARLWERRLRDNAPFRLLYVAEWHKATMAELLQDLMLCFHDDPEMLHKIAHLSALRQLRASDIVSLLGNYGTQRLVIVADQAFDRQMHVEAESFFQFIPTGSRTVRVMFASSPRFKLQGLYLAGEPTLARLHPFMDKLSDSECLAVAEDVLDRLAEPSPLATGSTCKTPFSFAPRLTTESAIGTTEVQRHLADYANSLSPPTDVSPGLGEARYAPLYVSRNRLSRCQ